MCRLINKLRALGRLPTFVSFVECHGSNLCDSFASQGPKSNQKWARKIATRLKFAVLSKNIARAFTSVCVDNSQLLLASENTDDLTSSRIYQGISKDPSIVMCLTKHRFAIFIEHPLTCRVWSFDVPLRDIDQYAVQLGAHMAEELDIF